MHPPSRIGFSTYCCFSIRDEHLTHLAKYNYRYRVSVLHSSLAHQKHHLHDCGYNFRIQLLPCVAPNHPVMQRDIIYAQIDSTSIVNVAVYGT